VAPQAAASKEPLKERTPQVDWAAKASRVGSKPSCSDSSAERPSSYHRENDDPFNGSERAPVVAGEIWREDVQMENRPPLLLMLVR
jgi:hypothetical protein